MANNSFISTASAKLALDAHTGHTGGAGVQFNGGTLKIYDNTGAQPPGPDAAVGSSILLGTYTFSATAFGASAASSGSAPVATAAAITGGNAVASGTALWARAATSGGTAIQDFSVGTSGCDINLLAITFTNGIAMPPIASMTLTMPLKNGL